MEKERNGEEVESLKKDTKEKWEIDGSFEDSKESVPEESRRVASERDEDKSQMDEYFHKSKKSSAFEFEETEEGVKKLIYDKGEIVAMSYKPITNEDSLSELISTMNDCMIFCKNMTEASKDYNACINWFHKSLQCNKRQTSIFVRNNRDKFTEKELNYFESFLKNTKKISKEEVMGDG